MKKLTIEEETKILQSITKKYLGHGSSRTVFRHPFNRKLAIKIAIGDGGKEQNQTEIEINQIIPEYTNTIHAYGENIIICDLLVRNYDRDVDRLYWSDWEDKKSKLSAEDIQTIKNVFEKLNEVNGNTADNSQIGRNINGKIVAYDYGFISDKGHSRQVDYLDDEDYENSPKIALEQLKG